MCCVYIFSGSFGSFGSSGSAVDVRTSNKLFGLIVELLYLAARLARHWTKERGIICMMFSLGFIYLVARLARQLMKERGIICMTFSLGFLYLAARLAR